MHEMYELANALSNQQAQNFNAGIDSDVIAYVNMEFYKSLIIDGMNAPTKYDKEQCLPFAGCPFYVVDNDSHPSYVICSRARI